MMYYGTNITAAGDRLTPIATEQLYDRLRNPEPQLAALLANLRTVKTISKERYAAMKRQLPYVVCGTFNPPVRHRDNFAYIDCFIVDIDHIAQKGLQLDALRKQFMQDTRVELCFVSPGGDGLKLLFQLSEKCYDHGLFSLFYKAFVMQLSQQYGLEQVIDQRTSDVTRACFLSHDPVAYYNPLVDVVKMADYINPDSPQALFDLQREVDVAAVVGNEPVQKSTSPDDEAIRHIKEVLALCKPKAERPPVYVPEQLNQVMAGLVDFLQTLDISITEIKDIQYGKQIHASLGSRQAENNLFYGKRGFKVVQTTKTGTNPEFNQMLQNLILAYLSEH